MRQLRASRPLSVLCVASLTAVALVSSAAVAPAGAVSTASRLHHAINGLLAAKSAHVEMTVSLAQPGYGSDQLLKLTGNETFTTPPEATFSVTTLASTGTGTQTITEVEAGQTVYVLVKGTWYSMSAQQALGNLGLSESPTGQGSPTEVLELLDEEGSKVTKVGPTSLDGSTMTEYRAVVDLNKALKGNHNGLSVSAAAAKQYERLIGKPTITAEVWIDATGALRQYRSTFPLSASALKQLGVNETVKGITETVVIDLSDFGVAVEATAPATSQPLPATSGTATG